MIDNHELPDQEKWQAVANSDKNYDGLFFYGVKTTGIFCRPSCCSKTPARDNVVFFKDASSAIAAGFRVCKRCRPDEITFNPGFELVKQLQTILDEDYEKEINLRDISCQLGVSINHLERLFKQHNGLTPTQYINDSRIKKSLKLLQTEEFAITEIAYMSGFGSISNFYKQFKKQFGYTPMKCRKIKKGNKNHSI